jgi:2-keto-3-deoxy-L-rhamnonate aldolase RhmA
MILSWQQIPSPLISEIMCHNFDGVVLDTEHGIFNNETLFSCIQVIKANKKMCLVRLTEVSKTLIRYCLDSGVDGLIFSTIESEQQCKDIVDFCYYAPRGKRGLGLVRQNFWGEKELLQKAPIIIPQIETKEGIDNLSQIMKSRFDYYLLGPYDLSLSIGDAGNFDNDQFLSYINKASKLIPKQQMAVHIPKNVNIEINKYDGYGIKCLGMDTIAILEYNKGLLNHAKL